MDQDHNARRTIVRFQNLRDHGIMFSRPQIGRMMKDGKFPAAVELSSMAIGWRLSDIQAWLDSRPTRIRGHSPETIAAISEGQRRRWQRWRERRAAEAPVA